jgi:hypothetical protein
VLGRRPHIGVATCALAPGLDEDGPLLMDALESAGADASVVLWDDDAVDWTSFDAVLVRSTWDYPLRRREFLAWASAAAGPPTRPTSSPGTPTSATSTTWHVWGCPPSPRSSSNWAVPFPADGRPAATSSSRRRSAAAPPTRDGSGVPTTPPRWS